MVSMDNIINFIQGVGFPIFVAVYLLTIFNDNLKQNTQVLRDLKSYLEGKDSHNGGV